MIDWLNTVLFHLGADAVTWAELLAFVTGGLCVFLTVRSHVANFPVGIVNSALFLVLFVAARLWADATLQIVFIALGLAGWWAWLRGGERRTALVAGRAGPRLLAGCVVGVVAATALLFVVLRAADDSAPFWDALTTALSLAAQYLLNLKKIQNWYFWIVADCIYVPLYFSKDLVLTGIVYVLFLGLCLAGLRAWHRELTAPAATVPAMTAVR